uniref:Uncharacterized protein n=1 Tax=Dendroctonus ponderosae TaxID=77166 RepID=A0AAR5PAL6_DENPD
MFHFSSSHLHLNRLQFNLIISGLSSVLFFSGWWIIADSSVQSVMAGNRLYYLPALVGTFAFFFTNIIPAHFFYDSLTYQTGCFSPNVARTYLLVCLMISFGCLIAAFYVLVNDFLLQPQNEQWPGYGVWLHNVFIFIASMLLRFARKHDPFY